MQKVSIKWYVTKYTSIINEYTIGLLETPLVPAGIEPEALDSLEHFEEAGFRDDATLAEVQDCDGSILETTVQLAKCPCRFSIIDAISY